MQWIFMLVGLILGGFAGESLVGALLGGLSGLALGQAVSLQNLAQQNERLRKQMSEFAERFERGTEVIHQRLLRVERQAQDLPESVPEPAAGIDQPLADTPPAPSRRGCPAAGLGHRAAGRRGCAASASSPRVRPAHRASAGVPA